MRRSAELPDTALDHLGKSFRQPVATLSLPLQTLLNILCLLGKKFGGSRTIAVLPSFYRTLMKCMGSCIQEWDKSAAHFYDSAVAGSNYLRAAFLRALRIENGTSANLSIAQLLWDMETIYDSVHMEDLTTELIDRG